MITTMRYDNNEFLAIGLLKKSNIRAYEKKKHFINKF